MKVKPSLNDTVEQIITERDLEQARVLLSSTKGLKKALYDRFWGIVVFEKDEQAFLVKLEFLFKLDIGPLISNYMGASLLDFALDADSIPLLDLCIKYDIHHYYCYEEEQDECSKDSDLENSSDERSFESSEEDLERYQQFVHDNDDAVFYAKVRSKKTHLQKAIDNHKYNPFNEDRFKIVNILQPLVRVPFDWVKVQQRVNKLYVSLYNEIKSAQLTAKHPLKWDTVCLW